MALFALANRYNTHLIVQPADLRLNPPERYLFVQDVLIIACGFFDALCYLCCIKRTYCDGRVVGPIVYVSGNLAYEVFYAFATTTTVFERMCFLVWFGLDVVFTTVAVFYACPAGQRLSVTKKIVFGFFGCLLILYVLTKMFPDDRQQLTAYWTGILLELPLGWVSVYRLLHNRDTKGHSIEIWVTRCLGCFFAYSVFLWRYWNVPQNWAYVGSAWSIGIMVLTVIPEIMYPFVYVQIKKQQRVKTE